MRNRLVTFSPSLVKRNSRLILVLLRWDVLGVVEEPATTAGAEVVAEVVAASLPQMLLPLVAVAVGSLEPYVEQIPHHPYNLYDGTRETKHNSAHKSLENLRGTYSSLAQSAFSVFEDRHFFDFCFLLFPVGFYRRRI